MINYFLLGIVFLSAEIVQAKIFTIKATKDVVGWLAVGSPGFLKIDGKGGELSGTADVNGKTASGTFLVDLTSYKTGISLRDTHMHEKFLETKKYPKATLEMSTSVYTEGSEFPWEGSLELKGVTKPVKGTATVTDQAGKKALKAQFKVNIGDYPSIGVPSYLGVTVAKEVEVTVDAVAE